MCLKVEQEATASLSVVRFLYFLANRALERWRDIASISHFFFTLLYKHELAETLCSTFSLLRPSDQSGTAWRRCYILCFSLLR